MPPPLLPLTRPQSAHHRNPRRGGGLLMLLMRGGPGHHRAIVSHVGFVGLRADGPETQLMLMMLGLGGVPTAENLVNTECFVGPRKNAPKIAHFTRSNGFVPTKHPNSRTPNALKGIRGLAFGGFVGTQAFKHIQSACLRGFWMAWGRPLMLMMLPFLGPKRLPKPKNTCLQRFLKVFRRQNACIECF